MQYNQMLGVLDNLSQNISKNIVLVGNNVTPSYCSKVICSTSKTEKEVAFGFQGTGGNRKNGKVISMHFKVKMTIGGLNNNLTIEFQNKIIKAFNGTGYGLLWENNMESWLLCHISYILPTTYICYSNNCKLTHATKKQVNMVIEAVKEAHKMLKKLGYEIRPDGEEEKYTLHYKKKRLMLYLMVKTPAGKFVISNHCSHAVKEMTSLDDKFQELRKKANIPMSSWESLRNSSKKALKER